jgi:cyclopropane-fatty-acyl-phospholipid synthase
MKDKIAPSKPGVNAKKTTDIFDKWARGVITSRLQTLTWGSVTLRQGEHSRSFGKIDCKSSPHVTITVNNEQFHKKLLFGGNIGAAEAYMLGYWSCDNLPALIRIMVRNLSLVSRMEKGWAWVTMPALRFYHWLRRNTRKGSQWNIYAHYDLGNDFYSVFLDETMTYSCGIFNNSMSTLQQASVEKYDRICRQLRLTSEDHVIEVGGGWGGFAIHAAMHYGCKVTSTTISRQQYEWAQERVRRLGLEEKVQLQLKDYRDVKGIYDKLVSIEMIEAVGHQYLGRFLQCCSKLLKQDGLMALQAITITDQYYKEHIRTVDFVKRYIFPGSCLVAVTPLCDAISKFTDMRPIHLEDITPHYAETLRWWRKGFNDNLERIRSLGFDEPFIRMWEYYLSYCEGAFEEHYIGDVQMVFAKPLYRCGPIHSHTTDSKTDSDSKED